MNALSLAVFFAFMLAIGIWLLPFVLLVVLGSAAIAASCRVVFWIFGPPELPKPKSV